MIETDSYRDFFALALACGIITICLFLFSLFRPCKSQNHRWVLIVCTLLFCSISWALFGIAAKFAMAIT